MRAASQLASPVASASETAKTHNAGTADTESASDAQTLPWGDVAAGGSSTSLPMQTAKMSQSRA